jgi:hypothetical protein
VSVRGALYAAGMPHEARDDQLPTERELPEGPLDELDARYWSQYRPLLYWKHGAHEGCGCDGCRFLRAPASERDRVCTVS